MVAAALLTAVAVGAAPANNPDPYRYRPTAAKECRATT
jgi:hypothetical protein